MNQSVAIGYRHNLEYRANTRYLDPVKRQEGYTEPSLTLSQYFSVILGSAFVTSCLQRPISKLERFYFLSDVPGESGRISVGDKQAELWHRLISTRWWTGPPLWRSTLSAACGLGLFVFLRDRLPIQSNALSGLSSGLLTGLVYAAACHPYSVLRATSEALERPKPFRGIIDVLVTALKERPGILLGLYRGVCSMTLAYAMRYGVQFGLYNYLRYDGVYRGPFVLFLYCHLASFLGQVVYFPLLRMQQNLHLVNSRVQFKSLSYRFMINEMRRRYGLSKLYDGFFSSKPILNTIPCALLLLLYDVASRRYTEYLHPQRKAQAKPSQVLGSVPPPSYLTSPQPYEFESGSCLSVKDKLGVSKRL